MRNFIICFLILAISCNANYGKRYPESYHSVFLDPSSESLFISEVDNKNIYTIRKDGSYTQYYDSSNIIAANISWKNGLRQGHWIYYYKDGKIAIDAYYRNDTLINPYRDYYPNGKVRLIIDHLSTLKQCHVVNKSFTIDPVMKKKELHLDSITYPIVYNGDWTFFWNNGFIKKKQKLKDCYYSGEIISWYSTGQREEVKIFNTDGELDSVVKFDKQGKRLPQIRGYQAGNFDLPKTFFRNDTLYYQGATETIAVYKDSIPSE